MDGKPGRYEYIVVGSGAGGGVVAARLAQAGHSVLLLEAGGDYRNLQGAGPATPEEKNRLPEDYEVPTFHAMATENYALKWDYFVRHYEVRQDRDEKFRSAHGGVLYPRAGTLGGCTAHDAMIMVYPHNADWNHIADITGDRSWRARNMRRYFQRLENCRHRWPYRLLYRLTGVNPTRHGFGGWLSVEKAIPKRALYDHDLVTIVSKAAWDASWEARRMVEARHLVLPVAGRSQRLAAGQEERHRRALRADPHPPSRPPRHPRIPARGCPAPSRPVEDRARGARHRGDLRRIEPRRRRRLSQRRPALSRLVSAERCFPALRTRPMPIGR